MKFKALFQLLRPANILTSVADVWAGIAVAYGAAGLMNGKVMEGTQMTAVTMSGGHWDWKIVGCLSLSTACLYGGGVVLNDYFDAELDALERPERPIPRGDISTRQAAFLGFALLLLGVMMAFTLNLLSGSIALAIALLVLLYDGLSKSHAVWGPLNMGMCRSANLLLGVAAVPAMLEGVWWLGLFPLAFISAVTLISRGEVLGGNKRAVAASFFLYLLLFLGLIFVGKSQGNGLWTVLFAVAWLLMAASPLLKAWKEPSPAAIRAAVRAGILSLIFLDASYAMAFTGWWPALAILTLLPLSLLLAKLFAVT